MALADGKRITVAPPAEQSNLPGPPLHGAGYVYVLIGGAGLLYVLARVFTTFPTADAELAQAAIYIVYGMSQISSRFRLALRHASRAAARLGIWLAVSLAKRMVTQTRSHGGPHPAQLAKDGPAEGPRLANRRNPIPIDTAISGPGVRRP